MTKNSLKIVGTILAKNEEDIIGKNIEHHLNNGVTHIILTDNGSTDRTKEIACKYPEVVEIIDEPGEDHRQSEWVTRMARMACKLAPDWIAHFDADELWCGLASLKEMPGNFVGSTGMYLHPPTGEAFCPQRMRHYLDLDSIPDLPGECKVAHRPDPDIVITHGNHGFEGSKNIIFTRKIWRHHYPVRSWQQFVQKSVLGHQALSKRNSICERWQKWHDLHKNEKLHHLYQSTCQAWLSMLEKPNKEDFLKLLELWATPEVIKLFMDKSYLPHIGEWPRRTNEEKSNHHQREK